MITVAEAQEIVEEKHVLIRCADPDLIPGIALGIVRGDIHAPWLSELDGDPYLHLQDPEDGEHLFIALEDITSWEHL